MRRLLLWLALFLQIMTWVPATSRVLAPNHDHSSQLGTSSIPESSQASYSSTQGKGEITEEASYRGVNTVGSRPPNCEYKCDGCNPCVAIQVPTITEHMRIQYANYEPESWKCKCGPSFYSP